MAKVTKVTPVVEPEIHMVLSMAEAEMITTLIGKTTEPMLRDVGMSREASNTAFTVYDALSEAGVHSSKQVNSGTLRFVQ